ncbi:Uncharacterised protein [Mycobacteroides abscessus subsp. abscessus]|nr:Uncharacterised protein [Mycobacteroides abscessus subsp. abscessus]
MNTGRPMMITTFCRASSPSSPANSRMEAATSPMDTVQNTRWRIGDSSSCPLAMESMTMEAESMEVTKKMKISTIATTATTGRNGKLPRNWNMAPGMSPSATTVCTRPPSPCISMSKAFIPKIPTHTMVKAVGRTTTPSTN